MAVSRSFTFRLQKLKGVREITEKQEQAKLQAAEAALRDEQAKLDAMLAREQQVIEEMTAPNGGIFDPNGRLARENWLVRYRRDIEMQHGAVQQAQERVRIQSIALQKASSEVKVLEKLEEKQREEWQLELLRDQGLFLDDLSAQQHIRKGKQREIHETERADTLAREEATR